MVFFWACEVTETKAAVVKIPESYVLNVCNATLASDATAVVALGLETTQMDGKPWKGVVAHLGAAVHAHQVKLDLVVGATSSQIKFYVAKGTGKVNLTGYFQPGPPEDLFDGQMEIVPAATPAEPSPKKANDKKRQRAEEAKKPATTWDQAASDSDEEEEKAQAKKQPKTQEAKKHAPAPAAAKPAQPPQANGTDAAAKKKKKNKKNKNKPAAN